MDKIPCLSTSASFSTTFQSPSASLHGHNLLAFTFAAEHEICTLKEQNHESTDVDIATLTLSFFTAGIAHSPDLHQRSPRLCHPTFDVQNRRKQLRKQRMF
eukprot:755870-Hanusia_phi.AAC.2